MMAQLKHGMQRAEPARKLRRVDPPRVSCNDKAVRARAAALLRAAGLKS